MATKPKKEKEVAPLVQVDDLARENIKLMKLAESFKIETADHYEHGAEVLKQITTFRMFVEGRFAEPKAAAWATHKAISKLEKETLEGPLSAEKLMKRKLAEYAQKQEELRQEEERKLEAKRLEELGRTNQAKQVLAGTREVTGTMVASFVPQVEGIGTRELWKFTIVNAAKIPREFLVPDEVKIGQMVRTMKGDTNIPGVETYKETTMVSR